MLGREGFLERAWAWKKEYGGRINRQQRRLGASCDWSRERFTMDEGCNRAVREVFVKLYEKGLIYRGNRIINWCPECQTALSDAEVEYEEQASHLWHIRYPGADGGEGVVVATTRPETMLGDTGVAVNPDDERYTDLVGKKVILPIMNKEIPVVADSYVDMEFGTGAVKMTPAHDPNDDFEVGKRHNLEVIRVTNDDGTMNENAGRFEGMTALACREAVVEQLRQEGYLVKIEDYTTTWAPATAATTRRSRDQHPVVRQDGTAGQARHRGRAFGPDEVRAGSALPRPISTGWRTSATGASAASSGGATASPPGTATNVGRPSWRARRPRPAPGAAARISIRMRDVLDTWFSSALCPSPRWAGRKRPRTSSISIPPACW